MKRQIPQNSLPHLKKGQFTERALLLILKWGGELTPSGRQQAEELGKVFRCMYPGGQGMDLSSPSSQG